MITGFTGQRWSHTNIGISLHALIFSWHEFSLISHIHEYFTYFDSPLLLTRVVIDYGPDLLNKAN